MVGSGNFCKVGSNFTYKPNFKGSETFFSTKLKFQNSRKGPSYPSNSQRDLLLHLPPSLSNLW